MFSILVLLVKLDFNPKTLKKKKKKKNSDFRHSSQGKPFVMSNKNHLVF